MNERPTMGRALALYGLGCVVAIGLAGAVLGYLILAFSFSRWVVANGMG